MEENTAPPQDSGSFMMLFSLLFMFMILFNPGLREGLGLFVNSFLYPILGFNNNWPVLTLLFAGIIMTMISVLLRHKYMDWVGMARNQKLMKAFSKEMREARFSGDHVRLEKLMKIQKRLTQEQMMQSSNQMKPMMFSFIFIISIFTWVALFIQQLPNQTFSVPWAFSVNFMRGGPVFGILPAWIGIYSLVSMPLGQIIQKALKEHTFKKRLLELDEEEAMAGFDAKGSDDGYGEDSEDDGEDSEDDGEDSEDDGYGEDSEDDGEDYNEEHGEEEK